MSRELRDWLTAYLQYTEQTEPPVSYHTWSGLSLLAGALQRKVHLRWGFEVIYPNMYVILVGPSGRARKGVALGIAKDLLKNVPGLSIAPESTSGREAIVLAMKRSIANFEDASDGKIKFHCALTAFSEELSVFLGQGDIKLLANLTDWYDCKDDWAYETIGRGVDKLQGLCFNLLGATAPDWLQSMLPHEAVGGGFTSRVVFVVEEQKGKTVPKPQISDEQKELGEQLTRDLERIAQISGSFSFTPDGEDAYVEWYKRNDADLRKGHPPVEDNRFAGYCERRATHIRKLMMLMSISRGDSLEITAADFERADKTLRAVEVSMGKTFGGLGKSRTSDSTELIKNYIHGVRITTRTALLAKFYRDIDAFSLKQVEDTLTQMGVLQIEIKPDMRDKIYRWVGD